MQSHHYMEPIRSKSPTEISNLRSEASRARLEILEDETASDELASKTKWLHQSPKNIFEFLRFNHEGARNPRTVRSVQDFSISDKLVADNPDLWTRTAMNNVYLEKTAFRTAFILKPSN